MISKIFILVCLVVLDISVNAQQVYNVKDYGASNDTSKLSTAAINKAVEACNRKGGGRVYIPSGAFKSGTIVLKDNVEIYLERGAVLYASIDPVDFPRQPQPQYRSQKDPGGWFALIYAESAVNIGIGGHGVINGQGAAQLSRPELLGGDRDGRPRNILFISCKKISVEGITMLNSGIWNQHYLNCEDVIVSNINVYNHANKNNDGIDIDGCRRFILSNSIIDSDDDGIVMKSTGAAPCEDIVIANCIVSSYTNAIKCGTESTGGFRNITVSNCTIKPSSSKVPSFFHLPGNGITGISLEIVDGGIMDGVNINNIVINGTQCPIYVRLGNRARKHVIEVPGPPLGQMRNIKISQITAVNTGNYSSSVTGVPGSLIENISFSDIRIVNRGGLGAGEYIAGFGSVKEDEKGYPEPTVWKNLPSYGLFIRHVNDISLSNMSFGSLGPDPRFLLAGEDINKLTLRNISASHTPGSIKVLLNEVRLTDIDNSKIEIKTQ